MSTQVELGCGLIRAGREWGEGKTPADIPTEEQVFEFLTAAVGLGIRHFDTAPSYGVSEARLGRWLMQGCSLEQYEELTIATKFGEGWQGDAETGHPFVDHSYDGLRRSLDVSMERLGRIDVLQLHKTSPDVLRSQDLKNAWNYADGLGITQFGASISGGDIESAQIVCNDARYSLIHLPYNMQDPQFAEVIALAKVRGMQVVVNRPFGSGAIVQAGDNHEQPTPTRQEAFEFILKQAFDGVVLTGTMSIDHLRQNMADFQAAQQTVL